MKKEKKNDYTFIYDKWNEVVRLTVEYFVYLSKSEFLTVDETMTNYMIRLMLLKNYGNSSFFVCVRYGCPEDVTGISFVYWE